MSAAVADGTPMIPGPSSGQYRKSVVTRTMWLAVGFAVLSGLLFGYDLCVISVALEYIRRDFDLSTAEQESVVSVLMGGAAIGAVTGGPAADRWGRRWTILCAAYLFIAGAVVMGTAPSFAVLLIGRFIVGVAVGASGMVVAVYTAEIAPWDWRAVFVSANEVAICVGCLVALGVDAALAPVPRGWRWMLGVSCVPAILQVAGARCLPESPRWLVQVGKWGQARRALQRFLATEVDVEETLAFLQQGVGGAAAVDRNEETELISIPEKIATQSVDATEEPAGSDPVTPTPGGSFSPSTGSVAYPGGSWWHRLRLVWAHATHRRMLLVALGVAAAQNMLFSSAVLYYSHTIFLDAGVGSPLLATIGVGIAKLVGVLASLMLVERLGRRVLLLGGTAGQVLALLAMAGLSAGAVSAAVEPVAVVAAVLVFILAWDMSWAPLMWCVCSEIMPAAIRGVGMGIAIAVFWLSSMAANSVLLTMLHDLPAGAGFLVAAVLGVMVWIGVYCLVVETKGLTLEEIESRFRS